jgi:hypothetical protein
MSSLARQLGLGRAAYLLWHVPRGKVAESIRAGGPLEQLRTARGRREMEAAAWTLPELPVRGGRALEVHVLTGRRFWYQTAFCLWTFGRHAERDLVPVIHDDGSLAEEWLAPLRRLFPRAQFHSERETLARLDYQLPTSRFPSLRRRREELPLIRKLTDIHVGQRGWRLFMDSDLLYWHRPQLLMDWLDQPTLPLRATDVEYAYGYTLELLAELAGRAVPALVNTGLLGLRSEELDWERLEHWCRTLVERGGTHYYQEQALVALHLAGRECLAAPLADYVTYPHPPEVHACRAVMHHYVADSKRWYFRRNWRRALAPN